MQTQAEPKPIPAKELTEAISDLQETKPLRAFIEMGYNVPIIIFFGYLSWASESTLGFLGFGTLAAFFYARLLISTHDCIHHTWTGIKLFDEAYPRLLSWPMIWFHGTYSSIHHLHHKMNGQTTEDPERVHWTQDEYEAASPIGKLVGRNIGFFNIFVFAGFGMIVKTALAGIRMRDRSKSLRRNLVIDTIGILIMNGLIYGWAIQSGNLLKYIAFYILVERVAGGILNFRAWIEHYGLWGKRHHYFQTQIANCRNIKGNFVSRWLFINLNYHSVHHSFSKVPFYNLAEAHKRLKAVYQKHGQDIPMEEGYLKSARAISKSPKLVVTNQPKVSGGTLGTVSI